MLIKLDSQNPAHQKFSHELQIERYGYKNTNIPFLTPSLVPTFQEHIQYLQCESLLHYYIFLEEYTYKGVIYLKDNKDICIFIAKKHIGDCCGERCLEEFLVTMKEIPKIPFAKELITTVNIKNVACNKLFERAGFIHTANLYGISL